MSGNEPAPPGALRDRVWCLLFALVIPATIFFWFLLGRLTPSYDAFSFFSPYYTMLADVGRSGHFLLWNPLQNGGSPDIGYPELGGFSPVTLGFALATDGGYVGFLIYECFIFAVAGAGFSLLALHLKVPRWATMAITAGLVTSGFFLSSSTHTSIIFGYSWLPLILWRLDLALTRRQWWPAVEAGALYGLCALSSHPQMAALNGIFLGLWTAGRVLFPDGDHAAVGHRATRGITGLALMLVVALAVLSPVYANFFHETAGYSERAGFLPRSYAISFGKLALPALVTLASPYLATLGVNNLDLWPQEQLLLSGCYVGVVIPALAALLLILRPRWRFAWWLSGMALFFLLAALGDATPVRGWLYDLLPPTRFFRHASIFRGYFILSLALVAAMAASELSSSRAFRALLAVSAILLSAAAIAFVATLLGVRDTGDMPELAVAHFLIVWSGLVGVSAWGWWSFRTGRNPSVVWLLCFLALIDAGLNLYLSRPLMATDRDRYRFLEQSRVHRIPFGQLGFLRFRWSGDREVNNFHLYAKKAMLEGYHQMSNRFFSSESLSPLVDNWNTVPVLSQAALGQDRIWWGSTAAVVSPSDATFAAFVARARQLGAIPLTVSRPEDVMATPPQGAPGPRDAAQAGEIAVLPAAKPVAYRLFRYSQLRLALEVESPGPGWLLVTDRWSRSWTVKVNGRPAPLWVGDFLFRAVRVGPGRQTVEFEFHPFLHPGLVCLSWGLMLMVLAVSIRQWRRPTGR